MATLFKRLESLIFPAQPEPKPYDPMSWFNELEAASYDMMDESLEYSVKQKEAKWSNTSTSLTR